MDMRINKYRFAGSGVALVVVALVVVVLSGRVWACSVPVYRYALERWVPDVYEAVAYYRGELSGSQRELLDECFEGLWESSGKVNVIARVVDVASVWGDVEEEIGAEVVGGQPVMVLYRRGYRQPVWVAELTKERVGAMLDSPMRREMAERLVGDDSVVWLLVESGDREKDDAAEELLKGELEKLEETIEMPTLADVINDDVYSGVEIPDLDLKFSVLRVDRNDEREEVLMAVLMSMDKSLTEAEGKGEGDGEPMAVPVFGRGRALYGLIGAGINADMIRELSEYLVGACTCEVKEQNIGGDLLISMDWSSRVVGGAVIDEPMPELIGMSAFESGVVEDEEGETVIITIPSDDEDDGIVMVEEGLPDENGTVDENGSVDRSDTEGHVMITLLPMMVLTLVVLLVLMVIGTLVVAVIKKR